MKEFLVEAFIPEVASNPAKLTDARAQATSRSTATSHGSSMLWSRA
jgi:hypothetical protein